EFGNSTEDPTGTPSKCGEKLLDFCRSCPCCATGATCIGAGSAEGVSQTTAPDRSGDRAVVCDNSTRPVTVMSSLKDTKHAVMISENKTSRFKKGLPY